MNQIHVQPVDVTDADELRTWSAVARAGYTHGREAVWWSSPETTIVQYQGAPKPGRTRVALWAFWVERRSEPQRTAEWRP